MEKSEAEEDQKASRKPLQATSSAGLGEDGWGGVGGAEGQEEERGEGNKGGRDGGGGGQPTN